MARHQTVTNPLNPVYKSAAPTGFDDDLARRAFPHRFRRIGSPFAYLNDIGIEAILEFIIKGHLLVEVAEATNVPYRRLQEWVANEGHFEAVDDAETQSAEGVMAAARKAVREAPTSFELQRAKLMLNHAEWMASKKNKAIYGEQKQDKGGNGGVNYIFNIGAGDQAPAATKEVIDAVAIRHAPQAVSFDPSAMFTEQMSAPPLVPMQVVEAPDREPGPILIADRPLVPSAEEPDTGPFYDGIEEVTPL